MNKLIEKVYYEIRNEKMKESDVINIIDNASPDLTTYLLSKDFLLNSVNATTTVWEYLEKKYPNRFCFPSEETTVKFILKDHISLYKNIRFRNSDNYYNVEFLKSVINKDKRTIEAVFICNSLIPNEIKEIFTYDFILENIDFIEPRLLMIILSGLEYSILSDISDLDDDIDIKFLSRYSEIDLKMKDGFRKINKEINKKFINKVIGQEFDKTLKLKILLSNLVTENNVKDYIDEWKYIVRNYDVDELGSRILHSKPLKKLLSQKRFHEFLYKEECYEYLKYSSNISFKLLKTLCLKDIDYDILVEVILRLNLSGIEYKELYEINPNVFLHDSRLMIDIMAIMGKESLDFILEPVDSFPSSMLSLYNVTPQRIMATKKYKENPLFFVPFLSTFKDNTKDLYELKCDIIKNIIDTDSYVVKVNNIFNLKQNTSFSKQNEINQLVMIDSLMSEIEGRDRVLIIGGSKLCEQKIFKQYLIDETLKQDN